MSLVETFWSSPPVTRTWATAVFSISIFVHAGLLSGHLVPFYLDLVFKLPPEPWRLATSFCFTSGLGIIFTPYLIWNNAGWLERESPQFSREPGKFLVYLIFMAVMIVLINGYCFGSVIFTQPLLMGLAYTWCHQNRGRQTNVYFVTLDARYVWPAFLFVDFLTGGWNALLESLGGIVAAHLYNFLTIWWPKYGGGVNIIVTPTFIANLFGPTRTDNISRDDISGRNAVRSSWTSTGFSSWNSRGQGRRLGGD